jgi:hypothetical protein
MRDIIPAFIAAAFAFSTVLLPVSGEAAPLRVKGERCYFPNVERGKWVGFFDGYEEATNVFNLRDSRRHITVWRCFSSKAECTAWKYWMQTDYNAGPKLTWCKRK